MNNEQTSICFRQDIPRDCRCDEEGGVYIVIDTCYS